MRGARHGLRMLHGCQHILDFPRGGREGLIHGLPVFGDRNPCLRHVVIAEPVGN
jgi:hypothetical protein